MQLFFWRTFAINFAACWQAAKYALKWLSPCLLQPKDTRSSKAAPWQTRFLSQFNRVSVTLRRCPLSSKRSCGTNSATFCVLCDVSTCIASAWILSRVLFLPKNPSMWCYCLSVCVCDSSAPCGIPRMLLNFYVVCDFFSSGGFTFCGIWFMARRGFLIKELFKGWSMRHN